MCFIFHHGRCSRQHIVCDQVFSYDCDDHTRRSDIFLYTSVDDCIFAYIYRFRQETGGNICHQIFSFGIWQLFEFCSIDRIILADIYIVCIFTDWKIGAVRDIRECFVFGCGNLVCFSVFLCFQPCFFCPLTGYDVIGNLVFHQVHRDHGKLQGCTTLKE